MLEPLSLIGWAGPFDADIKARALSALESGNLLFFPNLAFALSESEKQFLDAGVSDGKAKNISLDPATGTMQASSLTGEKAGELAAMMERFGRQATGLVHALLPYTNVERARTSFRPVEVKGRHYSKISDDRLLHIDAFPTRPMRGRQNPAFLRQCIARFRAPLECGRAFRGIRAWLPAARSGAHVHEILAGQILAL